MKFGASPHQGPYIGKFRYAKAKKHHVYKNDLAMAITTNLPTCKNNIIGGDYTVPLKDPAGNPMEPQVKADENLLKDYTSWNEAVGYFRLSGVEKYLTIGGFKPSSSQEPITILPSGDDVSTDATYPGLRFSVYYIDDVALFPFPTAYKSPTAVANNCSPVVLGNACSEELLSSGLIFTWYKDSPTSGHEISSDLHYTATVSGTYFLKVVGPAIGSQSPVTEITQVVVTTNYTSASISGPDKICAGSSIQLTANGGTSYSWNFVVPITTPTIPISNPGTYSVTVTNAAGCSTVVSKTITEVQPIPPTLSPISICSGPNPCGIKLPNTGGIISWNGGGVAYYNANTLPSSCPTQTAGYYFNVFSDALPTGLSPGIHALNFNFTDQNGCSGVSSINALIRETPNLSFAINSEPFCPGKDLQFVLTEPSLPGAQYIWAVDGVQESGTSINRLWTSEGTHQISLTVIPNNPNFCSNTVLRTIEVKRPSVKIFSKNYPSPITVCASVGSLELETVNVPGSTYDWQPASNITNTPQQNIVIAALNGLGNLPISVTISPYEGCSSATGQVTIISNQNQFTGSPGISYQFSELGPVSTANPIVTCSGNSIILTAGNGVTYTGSQPIIYRWLTPNNTLMTGQTLTLENLAPGTYVYGVQVVENLEQGGCGSDFSNITIVVGNPGNLKLEPVSISGFPNDFKLKASFSSTNADAFILLREVDNVAVSLVGNPSGEQLIDIYQHTPTIEPILMDGKYSVMVAYSGGCVARESFTVIGNKGIGTTEGIYQLSDFVNMGLTNQVGIIRATISGKVFVHHNVNIENVKVTFDHADVQARGDVGEPIGIVCQAGYPCPGPVNGTNIRFRGSLCDVFVSNSQFHSVLDRMWGGIDVEGISKFQIGQSYATYNSGQIADQSTIADAYVGLKIGQTPLLKYCSLTDVRFENCFYGLIRDSHEEVTGTPTAHNSSVIVGCTVTCDPLEMKNPYHSRDNNDPYQQFITQAGMILRGNSRYPGYPQSLLTNYSFLNNVFDNCVTGLRVMNDGPAQGLDNITVSGCTFTRNMRSGIESNYGIGQVRKTDFQIPTNIISYFNVLGQPVNGVHYRTKAYGIIAYNGLDAEQSTFSQFSQLHGYTSGNTVEGILSETIGDFTFSQPENIRLSGNKFTNLGVAIHLTKRENSGAQPTSLNFTLKCNEFVNEPQASTSTFTRKGLVIGEGVSLKYLENNLPVYNSIGGSQGFASGKQYPNANVWPVGPGVDRGVRPLVGLVEQDLHNSFSGWPNSHNWTAIDNQSGTLIKYRRYNNEFVGWGSALSGQLEFLYPTQADLKIATAGDGVAPGTSGYDFACGNFTDDQVVLFPARIAVFGPSLTENKAALVLDEAMLKDAFPNPSKEETRIGLYVPLNAESVTLQILEIGTGRIIQNISISERGKLEVLLDTHRAPAAIYGYRLLVDGLPKGSKKLVVQH
jgi:hypothetical protein